MMRQLINRGGRKPVPRMQAADKSRREQHSAITVNGGITKIRCDCIPAVLFIDALEVLRNFVKSFVPSNALPAILCTTSGMFEPIFIVVNVLQGDGLRADVAATEWIVFVTADVQTLVGPHSDFDPTHSFGEITVAIVRRIIVGGLH